MSERGEAHIQTIMESLACPDCSYDLRGLTGEVVTCPECGREVHVANYVAAQWKKRWQAAPLYNVLALPLAWITVAGIATLIAAGTSQHEHVGWMLLGGLIIIVMGWIPLIGYVTRRFGSIEGLWLALAVHLTLPGYIGGLVAFLAGSLGTASVFGRVRAGMLHTAMTAIAGMAAIAVAYAIERFVARRCIRRHLRVNASTPVHADVRQSHASDTIPV